MEEIKVNQLNSSAFVGLCGVKRGVAQPRAARPGVLGGVEGSRLVPHWRFQGQGSGWLLISPLEVLAI